MNLITKDKIDLSTTEELLPEISLSARIKVFSTVWMGIERNILITSIRSLINDSLYELTVKRYIIDFDIIKFEEFESWIKR